MHSITFKRRKKGRRNDIMPFGHSPSDFVLTRSEEHGRGESEKNDRAEKSVVARDDTHGATGLGAGG